MNADSLKVPLNENFIVDIRRKKSNGGVIAAFCCLVLLSSTALAFSVYAVVRLNDLENEYQTVIKNLLDDDLYKDMAEFQNEEEVSRIYFLFTSTLSSWHKLKTSLDYLIERSQLKTLTIITHVLQHQRMPQLKLPTGVSFYGTINGTGVN